MIVRHNIDFKVKNALQTCEHPSRLGLGKLVKVLKRRVEIKVIAEWQKFREGVDEKIARSLKQVPGNNRIINMESNLYHLI